jgi:hypothetical protein
VATYGCRRLHTWWRTSGWRRSRARAARSKKVVKKKQPERGYAHWTQDTFDKLVSGEPEPLRSHFRVNHQMVMSLLDRPARDGVDGCRAVRSLLTNNHESRKRQREHIRRTIAIYRSLVEAELLEFPEHPDEWGRRVRVDFDLQDEFALHQPLSLWAVEALGALPPRDEGDEIEHVFDVLSVIESVQESPGVVLAAQTKRAKDDLMAEMKSSGVEYEERMERLAQVEHPKPNRDWIYAQLQRVPRKASVGGLRQCGAEVDRPRDVRAGDDLRRVRAGLRPQAFRRCRAAVPVRRVQGAAAERARRPAHPRARRDRALAGSTDPPGRLEPDRRVGAAAASRRDRSCRCSATEPAERRRAHDRRRPQGPSG